LAETPKSFIPMKPTSIDRGMMTAVISAARTLRRNTNSTTRTRSDPSIRFFFTVAEVRSITSVWS
jgi:hypothetical protein